MTSATVGFDQPVLGIGEVLTSLQGDFPDVSISKIRFLETEGLVEPQRTASGYRKFRASDVERLRYVLRAQRDHYLPLRVIREHLDALDRGLTAPALAEVVPTVAAPATDVALGGESGPDSEPEAELRLSRRELLQHAGIDIDLLDALEEHGLIHPLGGTSHSSPQYDRDAFRVAGIAREMAAFGIEPRHLRALRTAVDREVGLIEQAVRPLQRDADSATQAARKLTQLAGQLHAALLQAAVEISAVGPRSGAA